MCNKNNIISGEKATSEQQVLTQEIDTSQIVVRLSCTFKVIYFDISADALGCILRRVWFALFQSSVPLPHPHFPWPVARLATQCIRPILGHLWLAGVIDVTVGMVEMVTPLILQAGECLNTFREKECVCV